MSDEDKVDTGQIATYLGVTREHVTDRLTKRHDFPKPVVNASRRMRRWSFEAVKQWAKREHQPA